MARVRIIKDAAGALKAAHEAQLTALYAEIGRLTTQVAWLKHWPATGIGPSASHWLSVSGPHGRSPFKPTS